MRKKQDEQILGAQLLYIVNLKFSGARERTRGKGFRREQTRFRKRLRERTERFWPELWKYASSDQAAEFVIRKMCGYLRRFWEATTDRDRDWYIHRARQYYSSLRVAREMTERREEVHAIADRDKMFLGLQGLYVAMENALDEPPTRTAVEDALFELQHRALKPSKAPRVCPTCGTFFLSERVGQKFCSQECGRPNLLASKRKLGTPTRINMKRGGLNEQET